VDFAVDATTRDYADRMASFLAETVRAEPLLAEAVAQRHGADPADPTLWTRPPIVLALAEQARERGLWNLFRPPPHGPLTTLQYATVAELSGHSPQLAPAAMNCAAPDTGNMELLTLAATEEQQRRWLEPLLAGSLRSAFCMTEPEVASSDALNMRTSVTVSGGEVIVEGVKWWSTGALAPECGLLIVLGISDPQAPPRERMSMVCVPRDAPGVRIERALSVFGYHEHAAGGHAVVHFDGVRLPASALLGGRGQGAALAQARLGPGRVHHCMRAIGMAERALSAMAVRAWQRSTFGEVLADQGVIQEWCALSRLRLDSARLLVQQAAWLMDTEGNRAAHRQIQQIKVLVPRTVEEILDRAIQLFGGAGVDDALPWAGMFAAVRTLRIADGPDEVHLRSLGREVLRAGRPPVGTGAPSPAPAPAPAPAPTPAPATAPE